IPAHRPFSPTGGPHAHPQPWQAAPPERQAPAAAGRRDHHLRSRGRQALFRIEPQWLLCRRRAGRHSDHPDWEAQARSGPRLGTQARSRSLTNSARARPSPSCPRRKYRKAARQTPAPESVRGEGNRGPEKEIRTMDLLRVNTSAPPGKEGLSRILGTRLERHRISAGYRDLLAEDLMRGRLELFNLTRRQALAVTRASSGYLATATQLTPEQRAAVEHGRLSLSKIHNNYTPNDATIERIVKAAPDRVMAALDKLT